MAGSPEYLYLSTFFPASNFLHHIVYSLEKLRIFQSGSFLLAYGIQTATLALWLSSSMDLKGRQMLVISVIIKVSNDGLRLSGRFLKSIEDASFFK